MNNSTILLGVIGSDKLYVPVALQLDSEETTDREFDNLFKIRSKYLKMAVKMDE